MKNTLKLAGTINLVISILIFLGTKEIVYPLILTTLSVIYFIYNSKSISYIYNKKTFITILSLINLFTNPISGIIMLIGSDKINSEYKNKKEEIKQQDKIDENSKKIDTLLKLGVLLISLSGIIFATTNWNVISNNMKIVLLIIFALIFISLSIISEKKLKIKQSTKTYWLLSMLFTTLSVIGIGYLETISSWFSFFGEGKLIFTSLTLLIISLLSLITYKKFNKIEYKNITYIGILLSMSLILHYFNISILVILTIINILLLILNIIKNKNIKELSKYLTIATSILSIIMIFESKELIIQIILTLINIINLVIISLKENEIEGIISPFIINAIIILVITNIDAYTYNNLETIIISITYSCLYLFNLFDIQNKSFKKLSNIIINIMMFIVVIMSIGDKALLIITTSLITITSIINYYKKTIKYEKILLPIKVTLSILSIIALLQETLNIEISYYFIIVYALLFILHKLIKNNNIKTMSLIMFYIVFGISLLINANQNVIASIINIIMSLILFITNTNESKIKQNISYITLLITILLVFTYTNILDTTIIINSLIVLLIYIIFTVINHKKKQLKKINYFSIILPLIIMIIESTLNYEMQRILITSLEIYIIILLNILLVKQENNRNIIITVLLAIILLKILFIESWIVGLYIGILSLIMIIVGFIKKEYKGIFIEGIVVTLINIIYQSKSIWKEIPLWLYLLIAGLTIIGIVTYKETKQSK